MFDYHKSIDQKYACIHNSYSIQSIFKVSGVYAITCALHVLTTALTRLVSQSAKPTILL